MPPTISGLQNQSLCHKIGRRIQSEKRRGDVIFDTNHYDDEFFKAHDINEVEDANLMQPYIEEIKKNIAK